MTFNEQKKQSKVKQQENILSLRFITQATRKSNFRSCFSIVGVFIALSLLCAMAQFVRNMKTLTHIHALSHYLYEC